MKAAQRQDSIKVLDEVIASAPKEWRGGLNTFADETEIDSGFLAPMSAAV